jgi:hypothetical protein
VNFSQKNALRDVSDAVSADGQVDSREVPVADPADFGRRTARATRMRMKVLAESVRLAGLTFQEDRAVAVGAEVRVDLVLARTCRLLSPEKN